MAAVQTEPLWIACGNGRVECGEQCDDGNTRDGDCSCLRALGSPAGSRGYRYKDKDRTPDGIDKLVLEPGSDGRAEISVTGRGERLDIDEAFSESGLRVQVESDNGSCWEAAF